LQYPIRGQVAFLTAHYSTACYHFEDSPAANMDSIVSLPYLPPFPSRLKQ